MYKCIKKDLHRTATWVFSKNENTGILKFEDWSERDSVAGFLEGVNGLTSASYGDSGSPYWTPSDWHGEDQNQAILVAIVSRRTGPFDQPAGIRDSYYKCINIATKMTSEILAWAKQKSGISKE